MRFVKSFSACFAVGHILSARFLVFALQSDGQSEDVHGHQCEERGVTVPVWSEWTQKVLTALSLAF